MRKVGTYDIDGLAAELFDRLPCPALIVGRDRVLRAVNSVAEHLGVEAGKHCWDSFGKGVSIPQRDREHFERTGEPPDGGTLWQTWWVPLGAETYLHYAVEVTRDSRDLLSDPERLERVQEIAAVGLWDQSIPDNQLTWSAQTCRIFGLPEDCPPGDFDAFLEMVHPEDREEIVRKTELALVSDGHPYRTVYRLRRQDTGEQRIVHEEARVERDSSGAPVRMVGVIHDITEAQEDRDELIRKIIEAEREIAELRSLIPICSHCKNIRDDKGLWKKVEDYFTSHGHVEFSHGICPACSAELYPDGKGAEGTPG